MNGWWCECCLDRYCECQGVDLVPLAPDGIELDERPSCYCCDERRCHCDGLAVHP